MERGDNIIRHPLLQLQHPTYATGSSCRIQKHLQIKTETTQLQFKTLLFIVFNV